VQRRLGREVNEGAAVFKKFRKTHVRVSENVGHRQTGTPKVWLESVWESKLIEEALSIALVYLNRIQLPCLEVGQRSYPRKMWWVERRHGRSRKLTPIPHLSQGACGLTDGEDRCRGRNRAPKANFPGPQLPYNQPSIFSAIRLVDAARPDVTQLRTTEKGIAAGQNSSCLSRSENKRIDAT
jgi:hypothetical protein